MHFEVFMSNDSMIKNQDAMDEAPTLVIKLFASMSCAKSLLTKASYWNSYLPTKSKLSSWKKRQVLCCQKRVVSLGCTDWNEKGSQRKIRTQPSSPMSTTWPLSFRFSYPKIAANVDSINIVDHSYKAFTIVNYQSRVQLRVLPKGLQGIVIALRKKFGNIVVSVARFYE